MTTKTDKICKEYIREIKSVFPFKTGKEKQYIKKLRGDIEDYCENEGITEKQALYESYGNPADVAAGYLSACSSDYVVRKTGMRKWVGVFTAAVCVAAIIISVAVSTSWSREKTSFYNQYSVITEAE